MKAIPGKRYKHYKKGSEYTVLSIGRLETNPEKEFVVYRMEYDTPDFKKGTIWLRERRIFEEQIEHNGSVFDRFTLIQ